jgi:hypothetical protein
MPSRKGFKTPLVAILIGFWKRLETDEEIEEIQQKSSTPAVFGNSFL